MSEKWYDYWWYSCKEISVKKKRLLSKNEISAKHIFNIEETLKKKQIPPWLTKEEIQYIQKSRKEKNWESEYDHLKEQGIQMVCKRDALYPKRLKVLPGMPDVLFVKGELPKENLVTAAIVGARNASTYGQKMTLQFAETLARAGVQIISGMARGIDSFAHRGALNVGEKTYAILGCGVDVCYPRENRGLHREIGAHGGVISEFVPGTPPLAQHFPARNRIISGLADIVLVMEARERSGSLITADMALEQGKDIYALPGPIDSNLSKGCHMLIRQGAGILLSTEDILDELSIKNTIKNQNCRENKKILESKEKIVYSCLGSFPRGREELLQQTGMETGELAMTLLNLELKGYIKEISKNYYILN